MTQTDAVQPKLAAVTGGTGFLGRFIVKELSDAGWRVRLLVRSDPVHPLIPNLNAEIIPGDLADQTALERLCDGADVIIHAAGLIKAKNRDAFFAVNQHGSANLAKACDSVAPTARRVIVSSLAAREPTLSDYAASKCAGEAAFDNNGQGAVTILRPAAIYGAWDKETFPLFQMASKGFVFCPKADNTRICLVHVSDVARAVVACAETPEKSATYEISDARVDGYSWDEIATAAGIALQTRPRLVQIPHGFFKSGAFIAQLVAQSFKGTPILTQGKVREILHGDWDSSASMQPPLNLWQPTVNLADGFLSTVDWYRQNNWL